MQQIEDDIPDVAITESTLPTSGVLSSPANNSPRTIAEIAKPRCRDISPNPPESMDNIEVKKEELQNALTPGARFIRYTPEEDSFLRDGVKKYGLGRWSHILKDSEYTFHASRTRDSLRMRAETIGLSKKKKSKRGKNR